MHLHCCRTTICMLLSLSLSALTGAEQRAPGGCLHACCACASNATGGSSRTCSTGGSAKNTLPYTMRFCCCSSCGAALRRLPLTHLRLKCAAHVKVAAAAMHPCHNRCNAGWHSFCDAHWSFQRALRLRACTLVAAANISQLLHKQCKLSWTCSNRSASAYVAGMPRV